MTLYSENALRKLNKKDLIGIGLSFQSNTESSNAKVLEELKLLIEKFDKLEMRTVVVSSSCYRKTVLDKCPVLYMGNS